MLGVFAGWAAVVFFPGVAVFAPVPIEYQHNPLAFPTQVGTKWVFQQAPVDDPRVQSEEITYVITHVEHRDEVATVSIARVDSTMAQSIRKINVSDRGLLFANSQQTASTPQRYMLKYPYKQGDKWESIVILKGTESNDDVEMQCLHRVLGDELIRVPAGTYKAIKVETIMMIGDSIVRTDIL